MAQSKKEDKKENPLTMMFRAGAAAVGAKLSGAKPKESNKESHDYNKLLEGLRGPSKKK